jgi:hypothetical protein
MTINKVIIGNKINIQETKVYPLVHNKLSIQVQKRMYNNLKIKT